MSSVCSQPQHAADSRDSNASAFVKHRLWQSTAGKVPQQAADLNGAISEMCKLASSNRFPDVSSLSPRHTHPSACIEPSSQRRQHAPLLQVCLPDRSLDFPVLVLFLRNPRVCFDLHRHTQKHRLCHCLGMYGPTRQSYSCHNLLLSSCDPVSNLPKHSMKNLCITTDHCYSCLESAEAMVCVRA